MYESFYGLTSKPFSLVPDARFFYASTVHKRGLAYLRYGLHQKQGFVVVTGQAGIGKSTLVQTLFTSFSGESLVVASITSSNLSPEETLQSVGYSLGVYREGISKASLLISIENYLKARAKQGKRVVLVVDEGHYLPKKSLEELRMLSNFQLDNQSLLQIILLGQTSLNEVLSGADMEQFSQRVIASCHLKPINAEETPAYIGHRLKCVGWHGDPSFTGEALAIIYAASGGVPRLINSICDRLMLSASTNEQHTIDLTLALSVWQELSEETAGIFNMANLNSQDLVSLPDLQEYDFPDDGSIAKKINAAVNLQTEAGAQQSSKAAQANHREDLASSVGAMAAEAKAGRQVAEQGRAESQVDVDMRKEQVRENAQTSEKQIISELEQAVAANDSFPDLPEKTATKTTPKLKVMLLLVILFLVLVVTILLFIIFSDTGIQTNLAGMLKSIFSP